MPLSDSPPAPSSPFCFRDTEGKVWDLKITLGKAKKIEASDYSLVSSIKFCFIQPDRGFFAEVYSNIQFAMALAWTLVQDQVEANYGVTPQEMQSEEAFSSAELQFINSLDGPVLQKAKEKLLESLADFFPDQRTVLLTLENKVKKARKLVETEIKSVEPYLDQMIEKEIKEGAKLALEEMRGTQSSKPPQSSDVPLAKSGT